MSKKAYIPARDEDFLIQNFNTNRLTAFSRIKGVFGGYRILWGRLYI